MATSTITEETVTAFAHCRNPRCDGYRQEIVQAVKTISARNFDAEGPLSGFAENSHEYMRFADGDTAACPTCGLDREVTGQERPSYNPLSGFPQDGLIGAPAYDPNRDVKAEAAAEEKKALEARLAEQDAKIERLLAKLDDGEGGG